MKYTNLPHIHFYNQDFINMYNQTWIWIQEQWNKSKKNNGFISPYFVASDAQYLHQEDAIYSIFFLSYAPQVFSLYTTLDCFYAKQEKNGAIRRSYEIATGKPVFLDEANPEALGPPLFAWAEYSCYLRVGNKRRLQEVLPYLLNYYHWVHNLCYDEDMQLYRAPGCALDMGPVPRGDAIYHIDLNAQVAMNLFYLSKIMDVLNMKDDSFAYDKLFFALKRRINTHMWDTEDNFYYSLDAQGQYVKIKALFAFWPLLVNIPTINQVSEMCAYLQDPNHFYTENPFPLLSQQEEQYCPQTYASAVFPHMNFMVLKAIETYSYYEFAQMVATQHIYSMLNTFYFADETKIEPVLWEAYCSDCDAPADWTDREPPKPAYLSFAALSFISLMIENVIGLTINFPRKTVNWNIPMMDEMGIEHLALKRNFISIVSFKRNRGWEIRLESEKLYYFNINIINKNKTKQLPIPSGKCSILINKIDNAIITHL